ncbi:MAG: alpha/beta hydrolase [Betaproteobacteria bacterium]|nr:alpha/beta hydrolase [Betaproteobacteria bacterium]
MNRSKTTPRSLAPELLRQQISGLEILSRKPRGIQRKTPLLFVHGAFAGAWVWDEHFLPWFAEAGYSVHALSLRGHGNSHNPGGIDWYSVQDYVDDLAQVARSFENPPVLIGHSMGGFVVQKFLEEHEAPAAVLMCSVPPQGLGLAQFSMLLARPSLLTEINHTLNGSDISLGALREAVFAQEISPADLERYSRLFQRESQRAIWDMSLFSLPLTVFMNRPPFLILGAEHDALIPAFVVRTTANTYGETCTIFPGMGHGLMLERDWEKCAQFIAAWLSALGIL